MGSSAFAQHRKTPLRAVLGDFEHLFFCFAGCLLVLLWLSIKAVQYT